MSSSGLMKSAGFAVSKRFVLHSSCQEAKEQSRGQNLNPCKKFQKGRRLNELSATIVLTALGKIAPATCHSLPSKGDATELSSITPASALTFGPLKSAAPGERRARETPTLA